MLSVKKKPVPPSGSGLKPFKLPSGLSVLSGIMNVLTTEPEELEMRMPPWPLQ